MRRVGAGGFFSGGLTVALAFVAILHFSTAEKWVGLLIGILMMGIGVALWFSQPSRKSAAQVAATGGRDAYAAGRDIVVSHPQPDEHPVALRAIRDEISHIERRIGQLEELRDAWDTLWPNDLAPYQPLPAERWNAYGAQLGLSDADHEIVRDAYEIANDFNQKMLAGPSAFQEPEPDLGAVKEAFAKARAVVDARRA
jgi:hypothetical protein